MFGYKPRLLRYLPKYSTTPLEPGAISKNPTQVSSTTNRKSLCNTTYRLVISVRYAKAAFTPAKEKLDRILNLIHRASETLEKEVVVATELSKELRSVCHCKLH